MPGWECAVDGCGDVFDGPEPLLSHQASDHERHRCRVCDATVPAGFFAIRHVLGEHTRAEYVRHYDADSDDIRRREDLIETVEAAVDVAAVEERLGGTNVSAD